MLKASVPSPFPVGSQVTLTCETTLLLESPNLKLFFSFYMGDEILETRITSSEYHIPKAQRHNSGLYSCDAATEDSSVLKHSAELKLQVLGEC